MTAFLVLSLALVVGGALLSAAARPWLLRDGRWRSPAWAVVAGLIVAAGASAIQDRPDYRDEMLGRLHPLGIFTDLSGLLPAPGRPASAEDQRRLADVLGPVSAEAAEALAPLKGRRPNVLVWALESVGARYMQSFDPLGRARTPILDAAAGRGSIVFTSAYCESPLSAQTIWALTTGMSPARQALPLRLRRASSAQAHPGRRDAAGRLPNRGLLEQLPQHVGDAAHLQHRAVRALRRRE